MPLMWVSLAFLLGMILASLLSIPWMIWILLALAIPVGALAANQFIKWRALYRPQLPYTLLIATASALCLGAARYQAAQPRVDAFDIAFYNDRSYQLLITGHLTEPPDYRDSYTNLKIAVEAVDSGDGDLPVSGSVLVRVAENQSYEYGERVRVRGFLATPPENEDFSYRDYLAREGIRAYMSGAEVTVLPGRGGGWYPSGVFHLKDKLLANVYRLFNDPEASLLAGILLGVDNGLTKDLQDAFRNTGTAHIIAISGFNIAIIGGIFFSIFKNIFRERIGAVLAVVAIFLYAFLVGGDAAVMRAAFMGAISLAARQLGRANDGLNALTLVAGVMAFFNPLVLWDAGFQLSFFATLGLISYAEPFSNFVANLLARISSHDLSTLARIINENVVLTFAAQLTTLPIVAYHFKRVSLISFIANPFILPVQPAVMVLSAFAVFVSIFIFPLGQLLAWIAWPFAAYTIRMVEFFNGAPHATIVLGDSSIWWVIAFYAVLLAVTLNGRAIKDRFLALGISLRGAAASAALALAFLCMILLWRSTASEPDGQLHLTFFDVGSADAILIQTPQGHTVLIDGGPSTTQLSDALGRRLPVLDRKIDWLVIASTNEAELASLPRVVERYPPQNVLWSGNVQASFAAQTLDKYFAQHEVPISRAEAGQKLQLGDGAFVQVLAEGPRGAVLLIQYEDFRALLPIGVSEGTYDEIEYGNAIGPVDVLLLTDSGYAASNPPDVVENVNPRLVILSVAAGDPDGLPSQDVLDMLEGYSLLRTDRNGWIAITTDGHEMRVEAERGSP